MAGSKPIVLYVNIYEKDLMVPMGLSLKSFKYNSYCPSPDRSDILTGFSLKNSKIQGIAELAS
jgi:hypothetical protein